MVLISNKKLYTGDDRVVEILVQSGADVNLANNEGDTALNIAAFIGCLEAYFLKF